MKKAIVQILSVLIFLFLSCQTVGKAGSETAQGITNEQTEVPDSSLSSIPALSPSMSLMLSPPIQDQSGQNSAVDPENVSDPQISDTTAGPQTESSLTTIVIPTPTPVNQTPTSGVPQSGNTSPYTPTGNTNSNPYNLPLPSNGAPVSGTGTSGTAVVPVADNTTAAVELGTEVRAANGTPVTIRLDEEGWVFLEDSASADLLSFLSRRLDETTKQTVFEFTPLKEGTATLRFQLQNLLKGYIRVKEIPVVIGKEAALIANEKKDSLEKADELFYSGKYKEALDMYQKLNKPSTAAIRDRIALTQWAMGQFKDAVLNWKANLNDPSFTSPALKGLSVAALIGEPSSPLSSLPTDLWKKLSQDDRMDLLAVVKKDNRILPENALKFFEMIPWESGLEPDYWLYKMGQWYEQNGPMRNVKNAKGLYTRLTNEYPLSDYYNPATERIDYIDRHFFLIN